MNNSQLDKLGDRLRQGAPAEQDLVALEEYRLSFAEALSTVREMMLRDEHVVSERLKSRTSLVEKLARGTTQLSRVQDIAGCRIEVPNTLQQDAMVARLTHVFDAAKVVDRRERPSHGYRAVHVIVTVLGKAVEIQVRTSLQQQWAELSEKLSDEFGQQLKYGGGPEEWRRALLDRSGSIARYEASEKSYAELMAQIRGIEQPHPGDESVPALGSLLEQLWRLKAEMGELEVSLWNSIAISLQELASRLEQHRRNKG